MNQAPSYPYEGVLLVDKSVGWTSHDVVGALRGKCQMKKIGHAGTLDPNATGLLVLLLGKATSLSRYLSSSDKSYQGALCLGQTTNTYDVDGDVVDTYEGDWPSREAVAEAFQTFLGDQYQTPPMFSAKKLAGVPLYKHARKGREIKRPDQLVRVSYLDLLDMEGPTVSFKVKCSKGTYIRSLAHDLGQLLGCGAFLKELRRTESGDLKVEDSLTVEALKALQPQALRRRLIPPYKAVPSYLLP